MSNYVGNCTVELSRVQDCRRLSRHSHLRAFTRYFMFVCFREALIFQLFQQCMHCSVSLFETFLFLFCGFRTSHGQTGCCGIDGCVQLEWAKRRTSTHRRPLLIRLPGAPYSLPTTVWLSDPQLPTQTLRTAAACSSGTLNTGAVASTKTSPDSTQPHFTRSLSF